MIKRLLPFVATIMLAGCATAPGGGELPPLTTWDVRRAVLAEIEDWGFSGRIAVRAAEDGFNGKLRWEQRRDYFDARLSGPIGTGSVIIAGDVSRVTVTDDDGEVVELNDPERDLQYRYGWQIPVRSLRFWVLGVPDPSLPATTDVDAAGLLSTLEQGGWHVEISAYREHEGQQLPRRITATRDDARVRLVIDRWTFY